MEVLESDGDPYAPTAPGTRPSGPPAPGAEADLVGRRLGGYEILREIGRGGMGVVYLARDPSLDREVALKVLQPHLSKDAEFETRFVREARTAAKLDHPNIVQVYTAGRHEDLLYIAMQLVKGETLQDLMKRRGKLPVAEALGIVRQAAEALDAAHRASLVHRDIKPNNIMIDDSGRVRLMDFGLMRSSVSREAITEAGVFYGTPEYASPEQCETTQLDGRSDLYSLGVVLYEMLAGRMPHRAETPMALFKKILTENPAPLRTLDPAIPAPVEALVARLMAKNPAERFASAADLLAELDRIVQGRGRVPGRKRIGWIAAGLAAALAVAAAFLFSGGPDPEPPPPGERVRFVVFDLRNGIPRPETAWYEIALSDMLIASLSRDPSLDVPTRDILLWKLKEMQLGEKITDENRRILTHELEAQAYLSGTYYVQGGKIHLTLTCYRLPESRLLVPAMPFTAPESDLFALVENAAGKVAEALKKLGPRPTPAAAPVAAHQEEKALALRQVDKDAPPPAPFAEGADELRKAEPAPASGGKSAGAPASPPPALRRPAPAEESKLAADRKRDAGETRREASASPADAVERLQAWYQSRQTLEKERGGKEEFDSWVATLQEEFQGAVRHGADERRAKKDQFRQQAGRSIEFACAPCGRSGSAFGRCPGCQKYMTLRIKPAEKKSP